MFKLLVRHEAVRSTFWSEDRISVSSNCYKHLAVLFPLSLLLVLHNDFCCFFHFFFRMDKIPETINKMISQTGIETIYL